MTSIDIKIGTNRINNIIYSLQSELNYLLNNEGEIIKINSIKKLIDQLEFSKGKLQSVVEKNTALYKQHLENGTRSQYLKKWQFFYF